MHGASEQCMHATEMLRSPATPSFSVTTRRRLTPQGTSFSALQAVTQPLHSMQRSASQMNFILAMSAPLGCSLDLADRCLGLLHHRHAVVAVGRCRVDRFAANHGMRTLRVIGQQIGALPMPREVKRQPHRLAIDPLGDEGARILVRALVTERVDRETVWLPFHFSGHWQGADLLAYYPEGAHPVVRGEAVNTATTYGYDSVTMMQESKTTVCQVERAA